MGPRRRGRCSDDRRSGRASSAFHRNQRRPQRAPPLIKVVVCHVSKIESVSNFLNKKRNKKEKKDHKKEDPKPLCVCVLFFCFF